jgi:hypothetical protein
LVYLRSCGGGQGRDIIVFHLWASLTVDIGPRANTDADRGEVRTNESEYKL